MGSRGFAGKRSTLFSFLISRTAPGLLGTFVMSAAFAGFEHCGDVFPEDSAPEWPAALAELKEEKSARDLLVQHLGRQRPSDRTDWARDAVTGSLGDLSSLVVSAGHGDYQGQRTKLLLSELMAYRTQAPDELAELLDFRWLREDPRREIVVAVTSRRLAVEDSKSKTVVALASTFLTAPFPWATFDELLVSKADAAHRFPPSPKFDLLLLTGESVNSDMRVWVGNLIHELRHVYDERLWRAWAQANVRLLRRGELTDPLFDTVFRQLNDFTERAAFQRIHMELMAHYTERQATRLLGAPSLDDYALLAQVFSNAVRMNPVAAHIFDRLNLAPRDAADTSRAFDTARAWDIVMRETVRRELAGR